MAVYAIYTNHNDGCQLVDTRSVAAAAATCNSLLCSFVSLWPTGNRLNASYDRERSVDELLDSANQLTKWWSPKGFASAINQSQQWRAILRTVVGH